ncbi:MAG: bifunctional diaminohydroxyphosphoribosylaminopyrimidine deaminase/5-amino-6-(5-phosphoribosylamino)uracil reductase RibD [Chitinophagaceae bacterium]
MDNLSLTIHQEYINRCLELAQLGSGYVAPNPMVGAVLVYEDRIIGEGWHHRYGQAHAEVNCLAAVKEEDKAFIARSVLYVSLEPCAHFGKTPPCSDLIIQNKIPKVVIGCKDPFNEVNGKGIQKLESAGVEVELADPLLAYECKNLNKRFFTFNTLHRPYIILKWAQTGDGFIAPLPPEGEAPPPPGREASPSPSEGGVLDSSKNYDLLPVSESEIPPSEGGGASPSEGPGEARLLISNEYSNRLVHKWRSEEAAILVGTNTAQLDDPELTNRLWEGPSPVRLVIDRHLRLPGTLKLFNSQQPTIIFNESLHDIPAGITVSELKEKGGTWHYQIKPQVNPLGEIIKALYQLRIQSVLVEGGAKLLQSFIDDGLWDEARVITNEELIIKNGLGSPVLENAVLTTSYELHPDKIETYFPVT